MTNKRLTIMVVVGMLFMASTWAMSVFGQGDEIQQKAAGAIQYRVVQVPTPMTEAQLRTILTAQGNAGFRFVFPFAVGTPIPTQEVLVFSKP